MKKLWIFSAVFLLAVNLLETRQRQTRKGVR